MLQALLSLIMASSLHAQPMQALDISHKTPWQHLPILSVSPLPEKWGDVEMPTFSGESMIAIDLTSGKVLYEKNSDAERPIASLTKLMTGLLIAEEENPYTIVEVSENASNTEGSMIWLNAGEKMTVKDLLYGMMISSGNDAALALAEYNAGSVDNFVKKMNQKSEKLGLENTRFSNPIGFDQANNYSTARDLAMLSMIALNNEFLMEPVDLSEYTAESVSGIPHEYQTTNKLLSTDPGIEGMTIHGLKTGTTPEAGECLITIATHDDTDQILTVVLGSADRFGDTAKLLEWINLSYQW